jgi:hypothetical protein
MIHTQRLIQRFQLVCIGRVYKFEAESIEIKKSWVEAILFLRDRAINMEEEGINFERFNA